MKLGHDDDNEMHELITTWVTATEKARQDWRIQKPAKVIFHWRGIPLKFGTPLGNHSEKLYFDVDDDVSSYELEGITLKEAARDEVIFCVDGEDSRKQIVFIS